MTWILRRTIYQSRIQMKIFPLLSLNWDRKISYIKCWHHTASKLKTRRDWRNAFCRISKSSPRLECVSVDKSKNACIKLRCISKTKKNARHRGSCKMHSAYTRGGSLLSPLLRLRHFPRRANFHCLPWWPPQRRRQPALPTLLVCVHALSLLLCHRGNWAGCVRTPILFGRLALHLTHIIFALLYYIYILRLERSQVISVHACGPRRIYCSMYTFALCEFAEGTRHNWAQWSEIEREKLAFEWLCSAARMELARSPACAARCDFGKWKF
jgi:hypothetical protein